MSTAGSKEAQPDKPAAEDNDDALIGAVDRLAAALERIAAVAESQKQPLRKG
jgi:hypothetical protein